MPLADKITEYFTEGNGDAFHDSIIDMLNLAIFTWYILLLFYFVRCKQNYTRYGSSVLPCYWILKLFPLL